MEIRINNFLHSLFAVYGILFIISNGKTQDLNAIDKKNPIKVTGGLNATQTFYQANGIQNRRDPYYWLLNANLNFKILGIIDVPLSASISQQNRSYTQPFNMYGISPRYKAVTVHAGYRSMQFSNFTLGGNIFLGGGVEVAPENSWIKGSVMYGRFTKGVSIAETQGVVSGTPAFERWGYGTKITIGRKQDRQFDFVAFHGKDNFTSIPTKVADSFNLKPAENMVVGIVTRQSITEKILVDVEYTMSAYTQDTRMSHEEVEKNKVYNNLGPLFTANVSTQFNKAILGNLTYNARLYQFRISYRRIDPEFKTMGSVFLNNDIEDITGNLGWRMFKNKMNISTGAGVQRNNLDNNLASNMNRFIGNITCAFMVSKKLNLNANYSNFIANTKINNSRINPNQLTLTQNADSLAYNQVTNSASVGFNYTTGNEKIKHSLFSNGNYQKANDNHNNSSIFYNVNTGYQHTFVPIGFNLTLSANYNTSFIKDINTKSLGPNLSVSKQLFKKVLRTTLGVTYLQTYANEIKTGTNSMFRFSNTVKKGKNHSITMDLVYMTTNMISSTGTSFNEFRGNLVYGFIF